MTAEAKLKWKNQIKEWRKKNPEKDRVIAKRSEHKRRLVRRGLNDSEHVELLASCENRCMICSGINKGKELHIDHDHISGSVRGLLCTKCNTGLGLFNDNEELLRRAIEYLRRGEGM